MARKAITKLTEKMTDRYAKFPCIPAVQGHALNHFRYGFIHQGESQVAAEQLVALCASSGSDPGTLGLILHLSS